MSTEVKQRTVYLLKSTDKPDNGTNIYVGTTCKSLNKRLSNHLFNIKRSESKLYKRMKKVGPNYWVMTPLLVLKCDQKTIFKFEEEWCKILKADLNTYSQTLNLEKKRQTKEAISKKEKKVVKCERCISTVTSQHLKRHQESQRCKSYSL